MVNVYNLRRLFVCIYKTYPRIKKGPYVSDRAYGLRYEVADLVKDTAGALLAFLILLVNDYEDKEHDHKSDDFFNHYIE